MGGRSEARVDRTRFHEHRETSPVELFSIILRIYLSLHSHSTALSASTGFLDCRYDRMTHRVMHIAVCGHFDLTSGRLAHLDYACTRRRGTSCRSCRELGRSIAVARTSSMNCTSRTEAGSYFVAWDRVVRLENLEDVQRPLSDHPLDAATRTIHVRSTGRRRGVSICYVRRRTPDGPAKSTPASWSTFSRSLVPVAVYDLTSVPVLLSPIQASFHPSVQITTKGPLLRFQQSASLLVPCTRDWTFPVCVRLHHTLPAVPVSLVASWTDTPLAPTVISQFLTSFRP